MLKIEDVKVGDELVCIDVTVFIKSDRNNAVLIRLNPSDTFVVKRLEDGFLCVDEAKDDDDYHSGYIDSEEFKCFKKKEQSQYTFDDLIDVAVQAVKDGLIICDDLKRFSISFSVAWNEDDGYELASHHDQKYIDDAIDFIQSLYKETFVIECEEDLKRVNPNPKITLNNGEVV
ncbi:MAG: hypothetical protein ACRCXK_10550, partial [Wohlfahrtiimonas sp.]